MYFLTSRLIEFRCLLASYFIKIKYLIFACNLTTYFIGNIILFIVYWLVDTDISDTPGLMGLIKSFISGTTQQYI